MPADLEQLTAQSLALPVPLRAILVERILASLDEQDPHGIPREWIVAAKQRMAELAGGKTPAIPAEVFYRKLMAESNWPPPASTPT